MRNLAEHPLFLLILVLLVVLLFGAKRLPDAARSIGRSMRIFKSEVKEMKDDDKRSSASGSEDSATASRPLEGRVVEERQSSAQSSAQSGAQRSAAEHEAQQHRSA